MSELKRYTIAVDFDGVIHSYTTPWVAPEVIPDLPVAGAVAWLFVAYRWLRCQRAFSRAERGEG